MASTTVGHFTTQPDDPIDGELSGWIHFRAH